MQADLGSNVPEVYYKVCWNLDLEDTMLISCGDQSRVIEDMSTSYTLYLVVGCSSFT